MRRRRETLLAICVALTSMIALSLLAQGCGRAGATDQPMRIDGDIGAGMGVRDGR